jgi:succinyl-CoA:acetate CoA-transferase
MLNSGQLRNPLLREKMATADDAASLIQDGATVGVSGFTPSGYPKATTLALAEQVRQGRRCRINLWSGASVGPEIEEALASVGAVARRMPYYAASNQAMRRGINRGDILYVDAHLSHMAQMINYGFLGGVDVAIVEAVAVTAEGRLILSCGVGNTPMLVKHAKSVIVELNTIQPAQLEGMHDIYIQAKPPFRTPIPIVHPGDRIGMPFVECGLEKIACVVESDIPDRVRNLDPPDGKSEKIAQHLIGFLKDEQKSGRMPEPLLPLQSGVGSIANSVLHGLIHSDFQHITMYSEILQDSVFDLIDADKLDMASGCAFTPSPGVLARFRADPEKYRRRMILRPLDITNHPEIIRRLGVIAINTALEFDIYGHANSTHQLGTQMMNGIGGSGDFMRNGYLTIFTTESTAKADKISRIVPMCSHVDSTEHDIHIFITEWGVADMRGLAPRERPRAIITHCAHPLYRDRLLDYAQRAEKGGGHTPHLIEEALSWHTDVAKTGTMVRT